MHLYLMHYVTNELLTATLATLTVYLCLRLLKNETPRAAQFIFGGLALGATMLTKATGILLLPIAIAQMFHIATSRSSRWSLSLAKSASPDVPGAGTRR